MLACCCTEAKETGQIALSSGFAEEAPVAISGGDNPQVSTAQLGGTAEKQEEPKTGTVRSEDQHSGRSVPSLTPSEKEAEKARLQQLVNAFAKKAVRGCTCTYLKEVTGERCTTQYRIDKGLEHLIVMSDKDPNRAEVTCPIAAIQDIYSLVEDGEACFPQTIVSQLSTEEQELLLMIVYRNGPEKMYRFCLLEESKKTRDDFLECLRILCIYAQSSPNAQTGGNGTPADTGGAGGNGTA